MIPRIKKSIIIYALHKKSLMKSDSEIIQYVKVFTDKIGRVSSLLIKFDCSNKGDWLLSKFKRFYPLMISFIIIVIGLWFIFGVFFYQTDYNYININPMSSTEGDIIFKNGTHSYFNPSNNIIPINSVAINIIHKIPVARGSHFEINKVEMTFWKDYYNSVDNIQLKLKGTENSVIYSGKQDGITPDIFRFNKYRSEFYDISEERKNIHSDNFSLIEITKAYKKEENSFILAVPKSNDDLDFSYELSFDNAGRTIKISGDAVLLNPIKCANDIEVLSMQTNKNILLMTGALIILGSFPC